MVPGESVTIDEQLYPYRGQCRYRQFMPSKPAKYGLKFWLLCDNFIAIMQYFIVARKKSAQQTYPWASMLLCLLLDHFLDQEEM